MIGQGKLRTDCHFLRCMITTRDTKGINELLRCVETEQEVRAVIVFVGKNARTVAAHEGGSIGRMMQLVGAGRRRRLCNSQNRPTLLFCPFSLQLLARDCGINIKFQRRVTGRLKVGGGLEARYHKSISRSLIVWYGSHVVRWWSDARWKSPSNTRPSGRQSHHDQYRIKSWYVEIKLEARY